jgi:hypothetical protein
VAIEDDLIFNFCHKVNADHQKHEAERLLYVGLTRAKQDLLISLNHEFSSPRSFWAMLEPIGFVVQEMEDLTLPQENEHGGHAKIPHLYEPEPIDLALVSMNTEPLSLKQVDFYEDLQRVIGLVLHDLLGLTLSLPLDKELLTREALGALWKKHGGESHLFFKGLESLGRLIVQCDRSVHAAFIFSQDHRQVFTEYELYISKKIGVKKMIIDRVVQTKDGQWMVIEFKSMLKKTLSVEQLYDYQQQVQEYVLILQNFLEEPVKGILYFLADDRLSTFEDDLWTHD